MADPDSGGQTDGPPQATQQQLESLGGVALQGTGVDDPGGVLDAVPPGDVAGASDGIQGEPQLSDEGGGLDDGIPLREDQEVNPRETDPIPLRQDESVSLRGPPDT
jgi:hypothetical protein